MTSENFSPWNSKMLFKEKVAGQIQNKYQEQKIKFEYSYNSFNYIDYIFLYYINTSEIPSELSCENFISSHVKITCYLHTWRDHCYRYITNCVFFTGVYIITEYYMPACGYEFYLLVFNSISHEWAQRMSEILSWKGEDKIHIHAQACNILYVFCNLKL